MKSKTVRHAQKELFQPYVVDVFGTIEEEALEGHHEVSMKHLLVSMQQNCAASRRRKQQVTSRA